MALFLEDFQWVLNPPGNKYFSFNSPQMLLSGFCFFVSQVVSFETLVLSLCPFSCGLSLWLVFKSFLLSLWCTLVQFSSCFFSLGVHWAPSISKFIVFIKIWLLQIFFSVLHALWECQSHICSIACSWLSSLVLHSSSLTITCSLCSAQGSGVHWSFFLNVCFAANPI